MWDDVDLGNNLWEVSFQLLDYTRMLIYLTALTTQIMAMTGNPSFSELNQTVWFWGVTVAGLSFDVLFQLMLHGALWRTSREKQDSVGLVIQSDWVSFHAGNLLTMAVLGIANESWMAAHYKVTGKDKLGLEEFGL